MTQSRKHPIRIKHLKQLHMTPETESKEKVIERAALSQYWVARAILAHPEAVVLHEGVTENFSRAAAKDIEVVATKRAEAEQMFPKGLPSHPRELSKEQKKYLAFSCGAPTLFHLQQLSKIYQTSGEVEEKENWRQIHAGRKEFLYEPREKAALRYCKRYANDKLALLIFGTGHHFATRDKSISLEESIDTLEYSTTHGVLTIYITQTADHSSSKVITGFAVENSETKEMMGINFPANWYKKFFSTKSIAELTKIFQRAAETLTCSDTAEKILTLILQQKTATDEVTWINSVEKQEMRSKCQSL